MQTSVTAGHDPSAWYAIWTRSRHEQVVRRQLEHKNIEAFVPTVARWSRWKDRKKRIDWPLFPSYCFARFDPRTTVLPVLRCVGAVGIVSFENQPAAIPDEQVNGLRLLMQHDVAYDPCPFIAEGDLVEVTNGPLRGVTGRLQRKNGKSATVVLCVELIERAVRVEVSASDIASLSSPAATSRAR